MTFRVKIKTTTCFNYFYVGTSDEKRRKKTICKVFQKKNNNLVRIQTKFKFI